MTGNIRVAKTDGRRAGQTLIIAIIILAVLLILGFAFASIIGRTITETGRSARRTLASDLATAGAEYAHYQMQYSAMGADWRPDPTPPQTDVTGTYSRDPDSLFLRQGSGLMVAPDPTRPAIMIQDLGGPDYRGPYSRVNTRSGRELIRARYSPNDFSGIAANLHQIGATAASNLPGIGRGSTIIETVGRPGPISTTITDPTVGLPKAVKVGNYTGVADLVASMGDMKAQDASNVESRKLLSYVSIGMLEHARYITNKDKVSRPADIGVPGSDSGSGFWNEKVNLGANFEGVDVNVSNVMGNWTNGSLNGSSNNWGFIPGGGSLFSNASLEVYGTQDVTLNRTLGEQWDTTGTIKSNNNLGILNLHVFDYAPGTDTWNKTDYAVGALDSTSPAFGTQGGVLRDGDRSTDGQGFVRGIGRIEGPSILASDPQGGQNRFDSLTRDSGALNPIGVNIGNWGYGSGVYVDSAERANRLTENQTVTLDPAKSLPNDWLNPDNANSKGWEGPYYVPVAPYLLLLPDGFAITRDTRSAKNVWRDPVTGAAALGGSPTLRYYIRYVPAVNKTYILNTIQAPGFNNQVSDAAFAANPAAREFNGTLKFAGDLRVKGVIPTNVQLTVVAMGSIYVEGSITKGVVGRDSTTGAPTALTTPSASTLMLMALDYAVLNTTQFFGPTPGQPVQAKSADNVPDTPNPVELDVSGDNQIELMAQFVLNPIGTNPSLWHPYAELYTEPAGLPTTGHVSSSLLLSVAADDSGPTYASLSVLPGTFGDLTASPHAYRFERTVTYPTTPAPTVVNNNGADPFFTIANFPGNIPAYGWTDSSINAYPKFETLGHTVYDSVTPGAFTAYTGLNRKMAANFPANASGDFTLAVQDPTYFNLVLQQLGSGAVKNLELARSAIAPYDVRIEAALFAENGSFFVIPGNWFNSNAEDTRAAFVADIASISVADSTANNYGGGNALAQAQYNRYKKFGNGPEMPFYGEPIDVKVTISGSVTENMPATMAQQSEWLKKWGWIPRRLGGTGYMVPDQHTDASPVNANGEVVPNLDIVFDPVLYSGQVNTGPGGPQSARTSGIWTLPPMPRLPVSSTLLYFGDQNP